MNDRMNSTRSKERQSSPAEALRDYHDWHILQLEEAAEQSLRRAELALTRGETDAHIDVQRYTIMLRDIRQLRASLSVIQR